MTDSVELYLRTHHNPLYINEIRRMQGRGYKRILLASALCEKYNLFGNIVAFSFFIIYPLVLFLRIFQGLYHTISNKKVEIDSNDIYLSFSMALPRLLSHANVINKDACCIYHNNYCIKDLEKNYTIYQLLSFKDVGIAGFNALKAFYKGVYSFGFKTIYYHLYSYYWFLTEIVCNKITPDATLYFANHMDEWAVLINDLNVKKKILFQHGTLIISHNPTNIQYPYYKYNEKYKIWTYNLPVKYDSIDMVYSFTEKEYFALCSSIVKNMPQKVIVGYGIKVAERKNEKFSLLIVGEYRTHGIEEEFIIKSLQNLDVVLYLKKHPVENSSLYDDLRNKYVFEFVDNNYFPSVDLVISYDSTLALEYESIGSTILYYDDFRIEEVLNIVQNLMLKNV